MPDLYETASLIQSDFTRLEFVAYDEASGLPKWTDEDGTFAQIAEWQPGTSPDQAAIDAAELQMEQNTPAPNIYDIPETIHSLDLRVTALETQVESVIASLALQSTDIQTLKQAIEGLTKSKMDSIIVVPPGKPVPDGNSNAIMYHVATGHHYAFDASAGENGEWLTLGSWSDGGGVNSTNVSSGQAFRRYNGMGMSSNTGIPTLQGIGLRLCATVCCWIGTETSPALEILMDNNVIATATGNLGGESLQTLFPYSDPAFRIIGDGSTNLWFRWAGNNAVSRPQAAIAYKVSLLPGDIL